MLVGEKLQNSKKSILIETKIKNPLSIFFAGILAITVLDSLGAIASFIIYVGFTFFLAKQTNKKRILILTGLLGLYGATIGWKLSVILGANTGKNNIEITATILIMTAIFMTLFASLLGLLGWWLMKKLSRPNYY